MAGATPQNVATTGALPQPRDFVSLRIRRLNGHWLFVFADFDRLDDWLAVAIDQQLNLLADFGELDQRP